MFSGLLDPGALPTSVSAPVLWGGLGAAVAWDVAGRRIPNAISLGLALSGLAVNLMYRPLAPALFVSFGGLLVGFCIWVPPYLLRLTGAADLKLVAALGVWLGPLGVLRASLYAAAVGGVLALLWLWRSQGFIGSWVFLRALPQRWWSITGVRATASPGVSVPYAVAIAAGVALERFGPPLLGGSV